MGLLSNTWEEWKKNNQDTVRNDFSGMNSDAMSPKLNTAGGITNPSYQREESPLVKNPIFTKDNFKKAGSAIYDSLPGSDFDRKFAIKEAQKNQQPGIPQGDNIPFHPSQGGKNITGADLEKDQGFLSKLSGMAGVDMDKAKANWKEKGGFEGLMSNPAFSLGLALMQSSANGKTINQGILNNFIKAGGISAEYKDRIEARKQAPIQATAGDMAETADLLKQMGIEKGNWFENFGGKVSNFFGGEGSKNPGLEWQTAVEEISLQYQKSVQEWQAKNKDASGKPKLIRKTDQIRIMRDLVKSGKIQKNSAWFGGLFTSDSLRNPLPPGKAEGGPVEQGKPYVVGEKGPEIIIPRSDGDVLTNDDSQIYAMLLASNPQLQKVSRVRAQKIMRNRFPEYFEG